VKIRTRYFRQKKKEKKLTQVGKPEQKKPSGIRSTRGNNINMDLGSGG
jgi:hypothetical protein